MPDGYIDCVVAKKRYYGFAHDEKKNAFEVDANGKRMRRAFEPGEHVMATPNQLAHAPNLMTSREHTARAAAEDEARADHRRMVSEARIVPEETVAAAEQQDASTEATAKLAEGSQPEVEDETPEAPEAFGTGNETEAETSSEAA